MAGISSKIRAANALKSAGNAIMDTTLSLYQFDAKQKENDAELGIAKDIEDFKSGLLSDPDAGTPITPETSDAQPTGYMKKFGDFKQTLLDKYSDIDNPLAKQAVSDYLTQELTRQESSVYQLQYQKYGENMRAATFKRIDDFSAATDPQTALGYAENQLATLTQGNMLDPADKDKLLTSLAGTVIQKDLYKQGRAIYDKTGSLTDAQRYIADNQAQYTTSAGTFAVSDQAKDAATRDLTSYAATIQEDQNNQMRQGWVNVCKGNYSALTYSMVEKSRLDAQGKLFWDDRLTQLYNANSAKGSPKKTAWANQFMNQVDIAVAQLKAGTGSYGRKTVSIVDPNTGETRQVSMSEDGINAAVEAAWPTLSVMSGTGTWYAGLTDKLGKTTNAWDTSIDSLAKDKRIAAVELSASIQAIKDQERLHPDWKPEQVSAYVEKYIAGPLYKSRLGDTWTESPYTNDSEDSFVQDMYNGAFARAIGGTADAPTVTSPRYRDALNTGLASVARQLNTIDAAEGKRRQSIPHFTTDGMIREDVGPQEAAKDKTLPVRTGLAGTKLRVVSLSRYPVPYGENREAEIGRELSYSDGTTVYQVWDAKTKKWYDASARGELGTPSYFWTSGQIEQMKKAAKAAKEERLTEAYSTPMPFSE
jgi:hypothetical protein